MSVLGDYSFCEAAKILAEKKQVICAVCAPEPIQNLPLNINEFITRKIADRVCEITEIPQTTPILQGIITPYKPIADIGAHKNRFCATVSDVLLSLCAAGLKKIFFLTSSEMFETPIKKAVKDYVRKLPADFSFEIIFWQNCEIVEKAGANCFENLTEYWRKESAIFMLAGELKGLDIPSELGELPFSKEDFLKWKKRGRDPEKLRKLSPNYRFSSWTRFCRERKDFSLFDELCDEIGRYISEKKI